MLGLDVSHARLSVPQPNLRDLLTHMKRSEVDEEQINGLKQPPFCST